MYLDSACVLTEGDLPISELLLLELLVLSLRMRSVGAATLANSSCCDEGGGAEDADSSVVATGWAAAPFEGLAEVFADCIVASPFEAA